MPNLTKKFVDCIIPLDKEKIYWDERNKGFGVRLSPMGRKTFVVQYRHGGRTRRISLGTFGNLTVEEARKKAKRILGDVAGNNDPAQRIAEFRKTPTMSIVCDRFLKEHVVPRLKPSTQKEYRRNIDLYILPRFKSFKITEVSKEDIAKFHYELADKPYQANRNLGVLSKIFNLCEVWNFRPEGTNPCRQVKKYKETKREAFLTKKQITKLFQTLDTCVLDESETIHVANAFKLLLLTGCRLKEIQTLKWEHIGESHIELIDCKTGYHRFPLSPETKAILKQTPKIRDNPYVIAGQVKKRHCTDLQKPWRRIRIKASIPQIRIHDLRHTFASHAVMAGHPLPIVGKLLGHTQIQTTMRYAHLADIEVANATNNISNILLNT